MNLTRPKTISPCTLPIFVLLINVASDCAFLHVKGPIFIQQAEILQWGSLHSSPHRKWLQHTYQRLRPNCGSASQCCEICQRKTAIISKCIPFGLCRMHRKIVGASDSVESFIRAWPEVKVHRCQRPCHEFLGGTSSASSQISSQPSFFVQQIPFASPYHLDVYACQMCRQQPCNLTKRDLRWRLLGGNVQCSLSLLKCMLHGVQGGTCMIVGDDEQLASEIGAAAESAIGCKVGIQACVSFVCFHPGNDTLHPSTVRRKERSRCLAYLCIRKAW